MKVLWIVNIMLPDIAKALGKSFSVREGWLSGVFSAMSESSENDITIAVAFPSIETDVPAKINVGGISCHAFYEDLSKPWEYDGALETRLKKIMDAESPDLIHIFGTEFPHCLAAVRAFKRPERTLIGIQGLCGRIFEDYTALLPEKEVNSDSLRDVLRKDGLRDQLRHFSLRAGFEAEALRGAGHVTGRTAFDEEETRKIHPERVYHKLNETMRKEFYQGRWEINNICSHSIFAGQADLPLKGFHFLLQAAGTLKKQYPDLRIYTAGSSLIGKAPWKKPRYGRYLEILIRRYDLSENVISLGMLTAEKIKEQYLKSAVFVCASYIENSPNTLAEAMLLGLPAVVSDAGGIPSMISEEEGIIFPRGDVPALAGSLDKIFKMEDNRNDMLFEMCGRAYDRARTQHDPENNRKRLLGIYREIAG